MLHFLAQVERGREARFAMQQELVYKVYACRNQMFAEWAAGLMGLNDARADAYVRDVLDHVFGDTDAVRLLARIGSDLERVGIRQSDDRLIDKLYELEGRSCSVVMERITGRSNVVPLRRRAKPDAHHAPAEATPLGHIDQALQRAKDDLARGDLQFRDMFLSMVSRDLPQAAE